MAIIVYNRQKESHQDSQNNYRCFRPHILSNPYTHLPVEKTKAIYKVGSRDDAVMAYDHYFDLMYRSNLKFKSAVDEIYSKYKSGEDVFLECYCHPLPCHCDVIKQKLEQRLLKEKVEEEMKKREGSK